MKNILIILGSIFLVLVLLLVGMGGCLVYKGTQLDKSSKEFVTESLPLIVKEWNKDELISRSSPQLLKVIEKDDALDKLFGKLKQLGKMRFLSEPEGHANMTMTTGDGKVISAHYVAKAEYENGNAEIKIDVIQVNGDWKYLKFYVESPIFLKQRVVE